MDRLQELLNLKDEYIDKLQEQLSAAVDKFEGDPPWSRPPSSTGSQPMSSAVLG